ncbi:MAG: L-rhamnose mutarotase [Ginsengibacter sp.]
MQESNSPESDSLPGTPLVPITIGTEEHRIAFKMKLYKGFEAEYKKRHAALWPDLKGLLKSIGISEYSIFFDETTDDLFCIMKADNPDALKELPFNTVMKKWWSYMKDIMETNDDDSPVSIPLKEIFYLP